MSRLTDEQLLKILGDLDTTDFVDIDLDKSNLNDFIREYGLQDGPVPVPNYKIYYEYKALWRPQGTKLSKIEFFRRFNRHFTLKRKAHARCYMLNEGAFDIGLESLETAKRYDRNTAKRKRNKKQKELREKEERRKQRPEDKRYHKRKKEEVPEGEVEVSRTGD